MASPDDRSERATSSTSQSSLVVTMFRSLDVIEEMDVLEASTATGYNCALLCERLGSEHVTSVEIRLRTQCVRSWPCCGTRA